MSSLYTAAGVVRLAAQTHSEIEILPGSIIVELSDCLAGFCMNIEWITTRRSIRRYKRERVSEEQVTEMLCAAMSAPSAGNQQPWHFVVVRDPETLKKIAHTHPFGQMTADASLAILICGDESVEVHKGYWVQDCSAATENLLLAAHALGLGAVWVGIYPREERVKEFSEMFALPAGVYPLALVPVGYPAEEKPKQDRYQQARVHPEKW